MNLDLKGFLTGEWITVACAPQDKIHDPASVIRFQAQKQADDSFHVQWLAPARGTENARLDDLASVADESNLDLSPFYPGRTISDWGRGFFLTGVQEEEMQQIADHASLWAEANHAVRQLKHKTKQCNELFQKNRPEKLVEIVPGAP